MSDDMSVLENDDARAHLLDYLKDVRAEDHHLPFGGERSHERFQHPRGADVETREWLVEDDDARVVQDSGGDENFLPHAFRIRRQRLVAVVVDSKQLEES